MRAIRDLVSCIVLSCVFSFAGVAQETGAADSPMAAVQGEAISVPRLIRYTGTLTGPSGCSLPGTVVVDFAIYPVSVSSRGGHLTFRPARVDTACNANCEQLRDDGHGHVYVYGFCTRPQGS